MLDNRTIQIVKSTIPLLESSGTVLTTYFYERLFLLHPELKNIFNMAHQRTGKQPLALFNALLAYAKHIDNVDQLHSTIEYIAQKHTAFLVQPEQYTIIGQHLLATLKELGGNAITEEVLVAWKKAYEFLADILIQHEKQIYTNQANQPSGWVGLRPFIITAKQPESTMVTSFLLTPRDGMPINDFLPGQYISLQLSHPTLTHTEIRQYSLSDMANGQTYRISVKRELGGKISNLLHDTLQVGDTLSIMPPAGAFTLANETTNVVLISAGVGQTPLQSMLAYLIKHTSKPILWLHACQNSKVHAFNVSTQEKQSLHPNLVSYIWYQEPAITDVLGTDYHFTGRINLAAIADHISPSAQYYFCGPIGFMVLVKQQLLSLGVPCDHLHYEIFGPHISL